MKSAICFLSSFVLALRPLNVILLLLTQLLTSALLRQSSPKLEDSVVLLCIGATLSTAAAGYLLNDIFDRKIDKLNKPNRAAFTDAHLFLLCVLSILLLVLSLVMSLWLNTQATLCVWLNVGLVVGYARFSKCMGIIKPLIVSYLTASSIFLAGIAVQTYSLSLFLFSGWAFLLSFVRELIKDLEDMSGDQQQKSLTSALQLGEKHTIRLVLWVTLLVLASLSIPLLWLQLTIGIGVHVLLMASLCVVFGYVVWKQTNRYAFLSAFCKLMMLAGVLGMTAYS